MKPIRILTSTLELLAEIDNYESLIFTRRYYTYGEFQLTINKYKQNTNFLQKGNIILLGKEVNKIGIIRHIELNLGEQGKASESFLVKGYTIDHLFTQRLILPPLENTHDSVTGDAETVIKHYLNNHIVNPADNNRKIDLLNLLPNKNRGSNVEWQSRYKNLGEELEKISINSDIGIETKLNYSTKKIDIDVIKGRNITASQSVNNPVIFSYEFDNIGQQHYVNSDVGYKNVGYVAGSGEGAERIILGVGSAIGFDRVETFIDARDLSDTKALQNRGFQKLSQNAQVKTLEGKILTYGPFVYEKDWDVGDIVTVQNRNWGITMDSRITEVKEIYEAGGLQLEAVFGKNIPTLIDKIKYELSQMSGEITK